MNSNLNINVIYILWWIDFFIRKLGKNGVWWGEVGFVGDFIVIGLILELFVKNKNYLWILSILILYVLDSLKKFIFILGFWFKFNV